VAPLPKEIQEKYLFQSVLGSGASGMTYRAHNIDPQSIPTFLEEPQTDVTIKVYSNNGDSADMEAEVTNLKLLADRNTDDECLVPKLIEHGASYMVTVPVGLHLSLF